MNSVLDYFISLQESQSADMNEQSVEMWNRRAEFWENARKKNQKGNERVVSAINYLEQKGLLDKNYDVADIGCGPGRFVAAFARHVHKVVGLDISDKMISHGMEHIQKEGLSNACLYVCDFQKLDIEKAGYKHAFDLVFSSMTPALHGMNGLMKSIEMSRAWCCNTTHLERRNLLREQIMQDVFCRQLTPQWNSRWFFSLFNILFLLGYDPETSYEKSHRETWVTPDEQYIDFLMEHMLPSEEHTLENVHKITDWVHTHLNEDGQIKEVTHSAYGRILWDVRNKTVRPDYRTVINDSMAK